MNNNDTIESRVADTILESKIGTVEIDGTKYDIAPPTVATLIMVSQIVSRLPIMPKYTGADVVNAVLRDAKDYAALGELAAVMVLGANHLTETRTVVKRKWFGLRRIEETHVIDRKTELAHKILHTLSPTDLYDLILKRINGLDISSFFVITTSLSEANLLKPTKEVVA
ncbi:MAG: hypothetical protein NC401_12205 [Ruminococcus sp.]|nr:hypothetical protein [Ruminococcus sp.]MCM1439024.1 hypothetical protein [Roseburia sp.]